MQSTALDSAVPDRTRSRLPGDAVCYAGAVLLGAILIVVTALRQPFSYDEITQITPYGSDDPSVITGATRQPPIDPLAGALLHHLLGQGQLQDRLVPVLAGIGSLVVMSLLLRRFGLGYAGAAAVLVMATSPLMLRYSSYSRPYALPMFVMLVMVWAIQGWLDTRHRRWLVVTAAAAFVLPLIRVPEPTVFLFGTVCALAWYSRRGRLTWSQTLPVIGIAAAALLSLGLTQYFSLASSANGFFDPSPSGVIDRFPDGVHELATSFVGVLRDAFPWWPISLLLLVAVAVIAAARKRLAGWPMWWPLLAAPVAFALAYHFVNPFPFDALPYRARAASFFIPAFILAVAALASVVTRTDVADRIRLIAGVLVAGVFVSQLPAAAEVVRQDAAPDFGVISDVITTQLPDDAIVLYDRPTPAGSSRQPFLGRPRYMGTTPYVRTAVDLPRHVDGLPADGPVYLLFNGQCAYPGRCVPGSLTAVDVTIPGWHVVYQHERFTLYGPDHPEQGQSGPEGVVSAMEAARQGLGLELGYMQTYVAAAVLADQGKPAEGKALIGRMLAQAPPDMRALILHDEKQYNLDPFDLDDSYHD